MTPAAAVRGFSRSEDLAGAGGEKLGEVMEDVRTKGDWWLRQLCDDVTADAEDVPVQKPDPEEDPDDEDTPRPPRPPLLCPDGECDDDKQGKDILLSYAEHDGSLEIFYFQLYLNEKYPDREIFDHTYWVLEGLSTVNKPFSLKFRQATEVPPFAERIHFNLTGLKEDFGNYDKVLESGNMSEPATGLFTAWELRQIKVRGLCSRTTFYERSGEGFKEYKNVDAPTEVCP